MTVSTTPATMNGRSQRGDLERAIWVQPSPPHGARGFLTSAVTAWGPYDLKRNRRPQPFDGLIKEAVCSRIIRRRGLPGYNSDAGYYLIEYYRIIGLIGIKDRGSCRVLFAAKPATLPSLTGKMP